MQPLVVVTGNLQERALQFAATLNACPRALEQSSVAFLRTCRPGASRAAGVVAAVGTRARERALWREADASYRHFSAAHSAFAKSVGDRFGSDPQSHATAALAPDLVAAARRIPTLARAPAGPLGCTSLAVLPAATQANALVFGRAHDLAGADPDQTRLVVHRPTSGLAHVSLHVGGAFLPGFSAVNERGICLSVHPATTTKVPASGVPLAAVAAKVIETATTIDEAIAQLHRIQCASGAAFVVASGAEGRAVVVEVDGDGPGAVLFPPRVHLAVGAPMRTRKRAAAFFSTEREREQAWSQLARLNTLARSTSAHTASSIALALGDDRDAYAPRKHRGFGNTVFDLSQAGAFVVDFGARTLSVASETARSRRWPTFSLDALFSDQNPAPQSTLHLDYAADSPREQARRLHAAAARNLTLVRDIDDDRVLEAAQSAIGGAFDLAPQEPLHALGAAIVAAVRGRDEDTLSWLARLGSGETSPYRRGLAAYLQARAHFRVGNDRDARAYQAIVDEECRGAHPFLVARAAKLNRRRAQRALAHHPVSADAPG